MTSCMAHINMTYRILWEYAAQCKLDLGSEVLKDSFLKEETAKVSFQGQRKGKQLFRRENNLREGTEK